MAHQDSQNKLKTSAHTLETDELLELLQQEQLTEEGPVDYQDDVLNFIATFTIEPGTERIKQHTLYMIYKAWSKDPISKGQFQVKMGNYFESAKISNSGAYLINQNAIKLTHAAYKYFSNKNVRINSKAWAKHYENFLKFHSLTKGDHWIHEEILYFIYDRFCHMTGIDKHPSQHLSKETFRIYSRIYLPEKDTKRGRLFGVSDNIVNFFQIGQLERMKKEYEKEEVKKKPKRKRRPRSKVKS